MPEAVFFDFDGVLVESTDVKADAYWRLFEPFGVVAQEFALAFHAEHEGMSRYEKVDLIYKGLFDQPPRSAELDELCSKYSSIVLNGVLGCRMVPGARGLLNFLVGRVPLFVISATPQQELELIIRNRGMSRYFESVHGSPRSKSDWVGWLMRTHGIDPRRTLFVGDTMSDLAAAQGQGIPFVLRKVPGKEGVLAEGLQGVESVRDLVELQALLAVAGAETEE